MIKSLSINVPLVEALEQMSGYAKFMTDLVTKKRSIDCETIKMTYQVSAIVHSMAPKLEDPDTFIIPCTIGSADFAKALCDLGVSINAIPYSVLKTLGIGQPRATSMRLQMVDRTMKKPLGKALVDVEVEELTFQVIIDDTSVMINVEYPLEAVLLNNDVTEDEGRIECVSALHGMGSYSYEPRKLSLDLENRKTTPTNPSIEESPILELMPLPPHPRKSWALVQLYLLFFLRIILEDDAKPYMEHQRRLNEAMQEVVKKELIKWLDVGGSIPHLG
ncbi:uncharacterized protein [Nicotiana sylvestris]|uniref:uncharacterized protein n=1 Tax=Nicotiana sylvestris TaxID=4096 RepID=UPI00388C48D0